MSLRDGRSLPAMPTSPMERLAPRRRLRMPPGFFDWLADGTLYCSSQKGTHIAGATPATLSTSLRSQRGGDNFSPTTP
eukprot:1186397-Lingulodinium_polyedra.AAC.1